MVENWEEKQKDVDTMKKDRTADSRGHEEPDVSPTWDHSGVLACVSQGEGTSWSVTLKHLGRCPWSGIPPRDLSISECCAELVLSFAWASWES